MTRSHINEQSEDISLKKLIKYNIMLFIPLAVSFGFSVFIGKLISDYFQTTITVIVEIMMFFFTLIIFAFIIPYIRKRENVKGIRFALLAILLVGISMTVPSLIKGSWGPLLNQLTYLASYILLTFIYVPEVLGMSSNIEKWFKQHKQLLVVLIYCVICFFYISGFGYMFYEIETTTPGSFGLPEESSASYWTFLHYSMVTFPTLGYGEIYPISPVARFVSDLEVFLGMTINVVFIAILLVYISGFQTTVQRKEKKEMLSIEEAERDDIRRLGKIEKNDVVALSGKEKKDFKKLLAKIKQHKKNKILKNNGKVSGRKKR